MRERAGLDRLIRAHDLIITGEGSFDRTSLLGQSAIAVGRVGEKVEATSLGALGRVEHKGRSPFAKLEGLEPHPHFDSLGPKDHAKRLEELAFRAANAG